MVMGKGGVGKTTVARMLTPLTRMRDAAYNKILLVTLPETTPVSEAAQLQTDLRRAGVEPSAWVVNASLAAATTRDPLLARRRSCSCSCSCSNFSRRLRAETMNRVFLDRNGTSSGAVRTQHRARARARAECRVIRIAATPKRVAI